MHMRVKHKRAKPKQNTRKRVRHYAAKGRPVLLREKQAYISRPPRISPQEYLI